MSSPENQERLPIIEALTENEKRNRVLKWTVPLIELDALIVPDETLATILNKDQWVHPIAEVSRIRADTQNEEGLSLGYFAEGYIIENRYTYNPPSKGRKKRPKYSPAIYPGSETVMHKLFPKTVGIRDFSQITLGQKEGPLTKTEMQSAIEWARIGYRLYTDKRFEHPRWIEVRSGVPILVFSSEKDLQSFKPFENYQLPENTQAVSFIAPGEKEKRVTPLVVCHETCSPEDIEQHIRTLLMFSSVEIPNDATPILVSQFTPSLDEYLRLKAKERILSVILSLKIALPENWQKTASVLRSINAAQSELFTKKRKMPEQSPLYIDDWPDIRKKYGLKYQEIISSWFGNEMTKAYNEIGSVPTVIHARELQLAKANFFSLFANWEEAAELFRHWSGRQDFRRSFGIPPKRKIKKNIINLPNRGPNYKEAQKEAQSPPAISEQID